MSIIYVEEVYSGNSWQRLGPVRDRRSVLNQTFIKGVRRELPDLGMHSVLNGEKLTLEPVGEEPLEERPIEPRRLSVL